MKPVKSQEVLLIGLVLTYRSDGMFVDPPPLNWSTLICWYSRSEPLPDVGHR